MSFEVIPVYSHSQLKAFINFPYQLHKKDPYWIPPLRQEQRDRLNPKKNPFFDYSKVQCFLAYQNNQLVGRISAQINNLHNQRYEEKTGHFGFFDCVENPQVAAALFDAAKSWIIQEGANKMVGPLTLNINEEVGLLIEGFDSSPFPYMPHNPPYYQKLFETYGFKKAKDLYAWKYITDRPVPEAARQIADVVRQYPGLKIREINLKKMDQEIRIINEIFNSAWSENWGFVPWTEEEIKKGAKDLKMILEPKLALIAEVNGDPAAISVALPNYHEIIKDLNGYLFPFGIFKLIYRLKTKKIKSARQILLGIKKEYRKDVLGALSVLLYVEMHRRSRELRHWGGEASWTLEDNEKINKGITLMGADVYKKYRVYEKTL